MIILNISKEIVAAEDSEESEVTNEYSIFVGPRSTRNLFKVANIKFQDLDDPEKEENPDGCVESDLIEIVIDRLKDREDEYDIDLEETINKLLDIEKTLKEKNM